MPRPPKNLTVVAQDFADFLNSWPDEYYFEDNNQEFYDSVFTCDAHSHIPKDPAQILNLEDLHGYIGWPLALTKMDPSPLTETDPPGTR